MRPIQHAKAKRHPLRDETGVECGEEHRRQQQRGVIGNTPKRHKPKRHADGDDHEHGLSGAGAVGQVAPCRLANEADQVEHTHRQPDLLASQVQVVLEIQRVVRKKNAKRAEQGRPEQRQHAHQFPLLSTDAV